MSPQRPERPAEGAEVPYPQLSPRAPSSAPEPQLTRGPETPRQNASNGPPASPSPAQAPRPSTPWKPVNRPSREPMSGYPRRHEGHGFHGWHRLARVREGASG